MTSTDLYIVNVRMLELIDFLKDAGTIKNRQQFLDVIGMQKQNFSKILTAEANFRIDHIEKACKEYKVNANWIFGIEKKKLRL